MVAYAGEDNSIDASITVDGQTAHILIGASMTILKLMLTIDSDLFIKIKVTIKLHSIFP